MKTEKEGAEAMANLLKTLLDRTQNLHERVECFEKMDKARERRDARLEALMMNVGERLDRLGELENG